MFTPIGKFVIEIIGWNMSVTNNLLLDFLIMPIILFLAYKMAFFIVHIISPILFFNKGLMSLAHWTIRIVIIVLGIDWLAVQFVTLKELVF